MNACSWIAPMVTLVDGREVSSESEEWRAECEARHILALPFAPKRENDTTRSTMLALISQRRGPDAVAPIEAMMDAVEPSYVLGLPNQAQRRGYLKTIENYLGENAATHLKNRAMELHHARKASNCAAPSQ